jgi:penicillin-binding protein 1A
MERIHIEKGLEKKDFTMPDSIVTARICTKSGKLAKDGLCNDKSVGNTTRVEYFAKGTEPTEDCDVHVKAKICTESNAKATDNCPVSSIKEKVFLIKDENAITDDTKYLLPKIECPIHKKKNIFEDEPGFPDTIYPNALSNLNDSTESFEE